MALPTARLNDLLVPVVASTGCDLEDLSVSPAGRRRVVRVVVDRDGGISLDDVAEVSRALSEALDDIDTREPALLGGAYVLEVSSPGVDRPLTAPRHWRRNVGRLVVVQLREGAPLTGRLTALDGDEALELDVDGAVVRVPLADVERGTVQVEFSRSGDALTGDDSHDADGDSDDDADDADDTDEDEEAQS